MGITIAITGKGGTGKTSLSALMIANLIAQGRTPVLAIDADPNCCLDTALGVRVPGSVGAVREETRIIASEERNAGVSKRELLELAIGRCLLEEEHFDLIAMGRPEGPGCYCYANNVLREVIRALIVNYPYIVIDNEAGLENISRRIVSKVDLLVVSGDSSYNGIETIKRLAGLAREMELEYTKLAVIINRVIPGGGSGAVERIREAVAYDYLVTVPYDPELASANERGADLRCIAETSAASLTIGRFIHDFLEETTNAKREETA